MTTFIRDLHVQALAVASGLDAAMLVAPVVGVLVSNDKHVSRLRILRHDAQRMLELTGEESGLEQEYAGPDYKEMLYELLEAVQLQGGNHGPCTADRTGVDAAKAEVSRMTLTLGRQTGDADALRGKLLEAVCAQDATCTLELYKGDLGAPVIETIENYPVMGRPMVRDAYDLEDGRRVRVKSVRFLGRLAIARASVHPPLPKLAPGEDWF